MPTVSKQESRILLTAEDRTKAAFARAERSSASLRASYRALGLAATAVVGSMVVLTRRALQAADNIGKTADSIGISTDALQEYRFAAQLAGVETETIDGAFQAFGKRLGELRAGTGTLTTFLDKYSATLKQNIIDTKNTDAALELIFDEMARLEDQSLRSALSAAAFGRTAGVRMGNLVRDGSDAIREMRQEARDLGIIIDEALIRDAERANDQLTRLGEVLDIRMSAALIKLAPLIDSVSQGFLDIIDKASDIAALFGDPNQMSLDMLNSRLETLRFNLEQYRIEAIKPEKGFLSPEQQIVRIANAETEIAQLEALIAARKAERKAREDATAAAGDPQTVLSIQSQLLDNLRQQADAARDQASAINESAGFIAAANAERQIMNTLIERNIELTGAERDQLADYLLDLEIFTDRLTNAREQQARESQAMRQIMNDDAAINLALWQQGLQGQLKVTEGFFGQLSTLQNTQSRSMFKVGKAAAIAQATISTYEAANKAYAAMAGIPIIGPALGIAAAAAAIAAGLANVAAIRSSTFGAAGGGVAVGGGGGAPPIPATESAPLLPDLTTGGAGATARRVEINLRGEGFFTAEFVRDQLIPEINAAIGDGATIEVKP